MAELIHQLKPYVTVFSAAIPLQCEHGDTVVVGGKVTGVLNMKEILSDALEEDFRSEGVYITLDDEIGEIQVCLAPKAYDIFEEKYGVPKEGDLLLVKGCVHCLDTTHTYEGARGKSITVDTHETETIRVLAYSAVPLPKGKNKKIKEPN